jgi:hypothetical protein
MSNTTPRPSNTTLRQSRFASQSRSAGAFWSLRREASLNWLALGLLLAAWNAADNDKAANVPRRPEALRGYPYVSVRAANRLTAQGW